MTPEHETAPHTTTGVGATAEAGSAAETGTAAAAARPALPGVVRRATAGDAAEAAWLAALTFPLACPPGTPPADLAAHIAHKLTPAHFRAWTTSPEHALLVHDDGERLLGYALLVRGAPGSTAESGALRSATGREAPYVELSKIYVHPDVLGGGVAASLMRGAVDAAAELGVGLPLWLATNKANQRAQAFYRKSGFEVVGERTNRVGGQDHHDLVLLRTRP
ncbi:GNAT family N-acetyltransferase [Promicromonospora sukumoe]|uniref:GNAT family N-acetyltransferase n=1 Tax=Promicromonospora sukumoe TaxID=88382 RepID=UPI00365E83C2